jgi:hypothetical protein
MVRHKMQGSLNIAQDLSLHVKVYIRTTEEKFPTIKKFSKLVITDSDADGSKIGSATVKLERQY